MEHNQDLLSLYGRTKECFVVFVTFDGKKQQQKRALCSLCS